MDVAEYVITGTALAAGLAVHVLKKVVEKRQENDQFQLKDYLTAYPYQTVVSVLMSFGGYFTLLATGELTGASAFLMGVTANSLAGAAGRGTR
jgi:hypothetical protein